MTTRNKNANTATTAKADDAATNAKREAMNKAPTIPMAAVNLIDQLATEKKPYTAIVTVLVTLGHAKNKEEAELWLKYNGVEKKAVKSGNINETIGTWLIDPKTEAEFDAWMMEMFPEEKARKRSLNYMKAIYVSIMAVHNKYSQK